MYLHHLLAIAVVVAPPVQQHVRGLERMKRELASDTAMARPRIYHRTIAIQWATVGLVFAVWTAGGQPLTGLGIRWPGGGGFWVLLPIAALSTLALAALQRHQIRSQERLAAARTELDRTAPFLPRSRRDFAHFVALAVTAGVCEEIIYRAFLIAYFSDLFGELEYAGVLAVAAAAVAFGMAHSYQGIRGVVELSLAGVIFGVLYVVSGSIWLPIGLHAAIDINGGRLALRVFGMAEGAGAVPT